MIFTTTEKVEGFEIDQYLGIVTGRAIRGIVFTRDIFAKFRDTFGGRVKGYEKELDSAIHEAFNEMTRTAEELGADAVVGIDVDVEAIGDQGRLLLVVFTGTAVKLKQRRGKDGQ